MRAKAEALESGLKMKGVPTMSMLPHKPIRSFVHRQGYMSHAQRAALESLWSAYTLSGSLREEWEISHPLVLEIGFGMGDSLLAAAKQHRDCQFIGVEVYRPGIAKLLMGLRDNQLDHVRVYAQDAVEVLTDKIPEHCLTQVWIFFPDPWPKTRHHKRRLIQSSFVALLKQKLAPSGLIHCATDWKEYAHHIQRVFDADSDFQVASPRLQRQLTKFERRGTQLGNQIYELVFQLKV